MDLPVNIMDRSAFERKLLDLGRDALRDLAILKKVKVKGTMAVEGNNNWLTMKQIASNLARMQYDLTDARKLTTDETKAVLGAKIQEEESMAPQEESVAQQEEEDEEEAIKELARLQQIQKQEKASQKIGNVVKGMKSREQLKQLKQQQPPQQLQAAQPPVAPVTAEQIAQAIQLLTGQPLAQPVQPAQSVQPPAQPVQPPAQPAQPPVQPVQPVQPPAQPAQPPAQPVQPPSVKISSKAPPPPPLQQPQPVQPWQSGGKKQKFYVTEYLPKQQPPAVPPHSEIIKTTLPPKKNISYAPQVVHPGHKPIQKLIRKPKESEEAPKIPRLASAGRGARQHRLFESESEGTVAEEQLEVPEAIVPSRAKLTLRAIIATHFDAGASSVRDKSELIKSTLADSNTTIAEKDKLEQQLKLMQRKKPQMAKKQPDFSMTEAIKDSYTRTDEFTLDRRVDDFIRSREQAFDRFGQGVEKIVNKHK